MKDFPSIPQSIGQKFEDIGNAHIFDKLDGRQVRAEWAPKKGWGKWGTKHHLFDHTDPDFGPAIPLFMATYAEPLAKIAKDARWERLTVYCELWGEHSLAGDFVPGEPLNVTLFAVAPYKKCVMSPKEFLAAFADKVPTPRYLGQHHWTRGFVQLVREGKLDGVTFEGVVGSSGEGHGLKWAKAKTQVWVNTVLAWYGADKGTEIVNS